MTNERAIELLRRLQDEQFDGVHGDERREALEMAVRALEPNLGENGSITCMKAEKTHDRTTGDSINRQQAIEAVRKAKFCFRIENDIYFKICSGAIDEILNKIIDAHVKALEDLPPAERARFWIDSEGKISALPSGQIATDTNVGDTISRQQAIEDVEEYADRLQMVDWKENPGVPYKVHALNWCINTLRELPSAQPETHDKRTETHACDLINRQQAIEAFEPEHHTDWYTPTIIKTLEELPQAQQDKSCKGCHFEKHGSRACDHCSRMYMDRYEVRNVD